MTPRPGTLLEGTLKITTKKTGFVSPIGSTDPDESFFIWTENLNCGVHGDQVRIEVLPENPRAPGRKEGRVVAILSRTRPEWVGSVQKNGKNIFVIPSDQRMYRDLFVRETNSMNAKEGDKVAVKITAWTDPSRNPEGAITRIFGRTGENNAEMEAILYSSGFEEGFPPEVEAEAEAMPRTISTEEISKRRDFRSVPTCTIDPVDAKDFDDALSFQSIERNGEKLYEVGVHIADVSHYLKEDSALDREAVRRATSVYMVDRVIPMLPEVLSNDLCSLRPNEDKLTFSAVFLLNENADIVEEWFGKTIIHSQKRFTYEEAQGVLDTGEGPMAAELKKMNELAYKLRDKKFAAGAVAFEDEEIRFHLDEITGKPLGVYKKVRGDTHKMIEDYMLLANKRVAAFVSEKYKENHFVYRNHDLPNIDRIANLASFIQGFGYSLKIEGNTIQSRDISDLMNRIKGTPEEKLIQTSTLRSMAKAIYSTKNIGHYSLAFDHYTHFTSPIRRYPDVMVHRLLYAYITGGKFKDQAHYEKMCLHSSEMEARAVDAERTSQKYKQAEYLAERVGQQFDALITGVTKWGMYAETINERCEGMIRLVDMQDDFYTLDEKTYSLVGQNTGRRFRLGDPITVAVKNVDLEKKIIDFIPLISEKK